MVNAITTSLSRFLSRIDKKQGEIVNDTEFNFTNTLVLYNDNNVDSMLAAALSFYVDKLNVKQAIPWHGTDKVINVKGFDTIFALGYELEMDIIHELITTTQVNIVIFMRRGSYTDLLDSKIYKSNKKRFVIVKPDDSEFVTNLLMRTDNTFSRMMLFFIIQRNFEHTCPNYLLEATPFVARFVTFSYPIADFDVDIGAEFDVSSDNEMRVRIRTLTEKLALALTFSEQRDCLSRISNDSVSENATSVLSYTAWNTRVMRQISRCINDQVIFVSGMKGSTTWKVRVVALVESEIFQLGNVPISNCDGIVAYEDLRGLRFYRVYSPDINKAKAITASLNPEHTFVDGIFVVGVRRNSGIFTA